MSADTLRQAAALMRERATAATSGPWEVGDYWHIQAADRCQCNDGPLAWGGVRDINGSPMQAHVHRRLEPIGSDIHQATCPDGYPDAVTIGNDYGAACEPEDAEHVASWHPGVALAVADWLDSHAHLHLSGYEAGAAECRAVTVARAYLGGDA